MKADIAGVKKRNHIVYDTRNEVMKNGIDNAYPSRIERITLSSITAKSAAKMYASFLIGKGFVNPELNKIIVGKYNFRNLTLYGLLEKLAYSLAIQQGAYVHCRWNLNFDIDSFSFFNYKNVRFGKEDDEEYSGKIVYYNNWDKSRKSKIEKRDFTTYDIFNDNKDVIKYQIAKNGKGDITKWTGQVATLFLNDEYIYPLGTIDTVFEDCDTEHQISLFKNGELSRNFFAKYFLKHAHFTDNNEKYEFIKKIEGFVGAENNGTIMVTQGDIAEDGQGAIIDDTFKLEKIDQNINDKLFVEWEQSIANNIRKSFNSIPKILIDPLEGVFGSQSGEAFKSAANFYNQMILSDRMKLENFISELMANFKVKYDTDFKISPLTFE